MKQYALPTVLLIAVILSAGPVTAAVFPLDGTKHDLSSSGTGSYKAISNNPLQGGTSEICIFCHTPHSGNTEAPLWNRAASAATYQTYTSDVLGGLGYWGAEDPKTGVPHSKTRICLSCHDGTIALGSVVNMPNYIPTSFTQIQMSGNSTIQPTAPGYIGIDLRDDHPVAIKHDQSRDPELVTGTSVGGGIRLYKDNGAGTAVIENADGNYIECTSCHNPHNNQYTNFLVASNSGSALCVSCHNKRIGSGTSAHDASAVIYNPDGASTIGTNVGNVRCLNCHYSHKTGVDPSNPDQPNTTYGMYLLSFKEEGACFNKTNRWGRTTTACHGNNLTSRDIESELSKPYAHKYASGAGKHRALEFSSYGWLGGGNTNWHVECNDCHNSHTAGIAKHSAGSGLAGNAIGNSSPLYGTGGVSISWSGVWSVPGSGGFSPFESLGLTSSSGMPANYYEYQVCLKCHSSFAWGLGTAPNSPSLFAAMTDQALEFNPGNTAGNNASMHPIAGATFNVTWGSLVAPWAANRGSQTMYCSDCHSTNGSNAQGPHGSNNAFMLPMTYNDAYAGKGTYQSSGLGASNDLCFKCHSEAVYQSGLATLAGTGFYGGTTNLHTQHRIQSAASVTSTFGYRCVNCHTRVPHGYNRKAMIVLRNEGAPYEAGGTGSGKIINIPTVNLPASGTYPVGVINKNANCTTVAGCHQ
jgi:predicted CXXCH cytochrome family protein